MPLLIPGTNLQVENLMEAYHIVLLSEMARLFAPPIVRARGSQGPEGDISIAKRIPNYVFPLSKIDTKDFDQLYQLNNGRISISAIPRFKIWLQEWQKPVGKHNFVIERVAKNNGASLNSPLEAILLILVDRQGYLTDQLKLGSGPYQTKSQTKADNALKFHESIEEKCDKARKMIIEIDRFFYNNEKGKYLTFGESNIHERALATLGKYGIGDQQIHQIAGHILQMDEFRDVNNSPFDQNNVLIALERINKLKDLGRSLAEGQQSQSQSSQAASVQPQQQQAQLSPQQQRYNEAAQEVKNMHNIRIALNDQTISRGKPVAYATKKMLESSFILRVDLMRTEWSEVHKLQDQVKKELDVLINSPKKDYVKIAALREKYTILHDFNQGFDLFGGYQNTCEEKYNPANGKIEPFITRICSARKLKEILDGYEDVIKNNPQNADAIRKANAGAIQIAQEIESQFNVQPNINNILQKAKENPFVQYMLDASKKFGADLVNLKLTEIYEIVENIKVQNQKLYDENPTEEQVSFCNKKLKEIIDICEVLWGKTIDNKFVTINVGGTAIFNYKNNVVKVENKLEEYQAICRAEGVHSMPWSEVSKLVQAERTPTTRLDGNHATQGAGLKR